MSSDWTYLNWTQLAWVEVSWGWGEVARLGLYIRWMHFNGWKDER